MATQLLFLVKNSDDVDVARFVLSNLADPANKGDCLSYMFSQIHADARRVFVQLSFLNRIGPSDNSPPAQQLRQYYEIGRFTTNKRLLDFSSIGGIRPQEGLQRLQKEFIKTQLPILIKQQQRQQQEIATIWRDLMKIDDETLIWKMKDPNPLVVLFATQAAGKKRLPVEKECTGLLSHANPTIRQAARQTLIRLGRGVDFGPEPTATAPQIAASIRNWTSWSALQVNADDEDDPTPPTIESK
jgi:hypothetical protein